MQSEISFVFLITAYNVEPYLKNLVASVGNQSYPHWHAVFVDDASTDGTAARLEECLTSFGLEERFAIIRNSRRQGKAYNAYQAMQMHGDDEDVIVMLDGDDWLAVDHALARLYKAYAEGWEVVWSNWQGSDGMKGSSQHFNPFLSPRQQPFVSSHLFSFKKRLFYAIEPHDLQDDDGKWFQVSTDTAIALPILSQTIKRKFIDEVLYTYNRDNPLNNDKQGERLTALSSEEQARVSQIIVRRQDKPLHVDTEFFFNHIFELIQAAMMSCRFLAKVDMMGVLRSGKSITETAAAIGSDLED